MRPEAERWWRQTQEDLKTVQALLSAKRFGAAAFYSHQAVEKALKGYIVERCRRTAPWLHDLVELADTAQDCGGTRFPTGLLTSLRQLNHHHTVPRYPDAANGVPEEQYDELISSRALEQAQEVIKWLETKLSRRG